jgi:AAA family ATP:ADP antiporter
MEIKSKMARLVAIVVVSCLVHSSYALKFKATPKTIINTPISAFSTPANKQRMQPISMMKKSNYINSSNSLQGMGGSEGLNSIYTQTDTALHAATATPIVKEEPGENIGKTMKKILPLGAMLFFILFNYTILRDTKDVLVVTAPGGGAEMIPFLKTYVNLPSSIGFAILYANLCNVMPTDNVFYVVMAAFISFFGSFAAFIYPNRNLFHPNAAADFLATRAPVALLPLVAIFRNWTYAVFYTLANMWGSVVVSLLFWGFANEITTVSEAKKYYPLFGLMANVALIFSGQYVKYVSNLPVAPGVDKWVNSLKYLMAAVVGGGSVIVGLMKYMQSCVLTDPDCVDPNKEAKRKKQKTKMTMKESAQFLSNSPYIRDLALLVIGYGMSINIIEVTWKSKLKAAFPDPNAYSAFMGNFSSSTGVITLLMMLAGRVIFKRFGWRTAALITPVTILSTGIAFFFIDYVPCSFCPHYCTNWYYTSHDGSYDWCNPKYFIKRRQVFFV